MLQGRAVGFRCARDGAVDDVTTNPRPRPPSLMDSSTFPYIGAETAVETKDGRVFVGALRCIDKQRNVVLSNAAQYDGWDAFTRRRDTRAADAAADAPPPPTVNMILVGVDARVRCEVNARTVVAPTPTT